MKVTKDFELQEFVCKEIWDKWHDKSLWFVDRRIIDIVQHLREKTGKPITINNWHTNGNYNESGLRRFDTKTGGSMSQHKFGRAADVKVKDMKPAEVLVLIKANWTGFKWKGLTTIEDVKFTPTWLHLDCREWGDEELHIVAP